MMRDFPNDFSTAAHQVLSYLHNRLGFGLWMVMRCDGNGWIVLAAEDHCYGVRDGTSFHWSESLSAHGHKAGHVVFRPEWSGVSAHASPGSLLASPLGQGRQIDVGTYVSIPLRGDDGVLYGSLCALDPAPQEEARIKEERALVDMLAGLLCRLLCTELKAVDESIRAERAEAESMRDALTALYGRRGWNQLLRKEEERCCRYGHPAYVVFVDLDDLKQVNDTLGHAAGDELLIRTGHALLEVTRESDVVARVGGDEFAVLAVECDEIAASSLVDKLRDRLRAANINASIGVAARRPDHGLETAWMEADADMYQQKKYRKSVAGMAHASNIYPLQSMC